jgi:hypothetical protein
MTQWFARICTGALAVSLLSAWLFESPDAFAQPTNSVQTLRIPNGGIQPQVATDANGVVHLVYYTGDPLNGDLFYVHSANGGLTFSSPVRVNSQNGSAIAVGNIRGARIAVGRNGRIYIAWNGSSTAEPKTADGRAPMLYTRLDDAGRGFETQRSLIRSAAGIDGGGAVAADRLGNVFVFWHAPIPGGKGEPDRRVWVTQSRDDGKTFENERVAFDKPTGVCGCCGMNASIDAHGDVYALFRSAGEVVNRDMYLLSSQDHGRTFQGTDVSPWKVGYCVMSSEAFAQSDMGTLAAWETEKQIFYARVNKKSGLTGTAISAPGTGANRKHPALAVNRQGATLLAWTEGMAWKKGGSLSWQMFDRSGRAIGEVGHAEGVPVWGLLAAFTAPDGSFRIVY